MVRIRSVEFVRHHQVELGFTDGTRRIVDLEPHMNGVVFEPLRRDPELFRMVQVDPELGTIVWPNGADLDPDVLYAGGTPEWAARRERMG